MPKSLPLHLYTEIRSREFYEVIFFLQNQSKANEYGTLKVGRLVKNLTVKNSLPEVNLFEIGECCIFCKSG